MSDFKRFLLYFIKSFFIFFFILFLVYTVIYGLQTALLAATFISALFSLFIAGHLERNLQRDILEINSKNKNPNKGLKEYNQMIEDYLNEMRYNLIQVEENTKTYSPRPLLKIMGGDVKITSTPYDIEVEAPRGTIKILASLLDLKKIFF